MGINWHRPQTPDHRSQTTHFKSFLLPELGKSERHKRRIFGNNGRTKFWDFMGLNFFLVKTLWANPLPLSPSAPILSRLASSTDSLVACHCRHPPLLSQRPLPTSTKLSPSLVGGDGGIAASIAVVPLLLFVLHHLPPCADFAATVVTASSSSPRPLSLCHPMPAHVAASATTLTLLPPPSSP